MKMLLLTALRGSIILYQGEELGLPQVDVPFEQLQDPEAIANWPQTLSRDGARTPMPWDSTARALGFSAADPWLSAGENHRALAIDLQQGNQGSLLNFTRQCLALRKSHPALRTGSINILQATDAALVLDRESNDQKLRCSFNLSASPIAFRPSGKALLAAGEVGSDTLAPYAAIIEELA